MNKNLIIYLLISVFSFLFVHSELTIADCEEHMHEQHDFCVLVQYTVPAKQLVNIVKDVNSIEIEPFLDIVNPTQNSFSINKSDYPKQNTNSKPLYIVKQSLLI